MKKILSMASVILLFPALLGAAQIGKFPLGCGDTLEITVWGDESLSRKVLVRPDGKISFPLVGDLTAAGVEVEALRQTLQTKISEFIHEAPVTVMLMEARSARVSVVGKVNKPGVFPMDGPMSVLQALAMAGGMTPYASTGSIRIIRSESSGEQRFIAFDYDKVADGKNLDQNIRLDPGDVVLVP